MRSFSFRLFVLSLLVAPALVRGQAPAAPVAAEVFVVQPTPMAESIETVGTLRARESVDIVPELTKRLTRIAMKEGGSVEKDELLFLLDDADLVAEIAEIDARIKLAETNAARVETLLPQRAVSRQEYDFAKAELGIIQAQKATKEVALTKTRIRAPFGGKIGIRHVSEGALVEPKTVLTTLQDLSAIKVDFPLPERYAGDLRVGQKFTFTVAGNASVFEGEVAVIEPAADAATRSLRARGICKEPKGLLPGAFAEVSLQLDRIAQGFAIPSQAVVPSPRGHGVYLLRDGKAEFREIEIGIRSDVQVQVLRGLKEGDQLLITNLLRLRPGVPVQATSR
ncbi:MAG: efflux RND transporter periplasmic adaptor subunit [Verrucomicrobia bacterium]|nr:MAG: efflux RND transporter periplasmic adaptor subunit [Verrucomicrobiota bacterium]TAE88409.1 MAG: efflux RND transporter periplasmic adaptor subunit [Verrucomicrobiota bacterium]TAF26862.1 MAG: efflux RND transporter periplasmic adaptor subunit [Verrucomicrobiota bacterium]TAF42120.1 MAG: efflux RND transporter periplasmic adaptor subunit [Verrucomicrobiota bacterium]